MAAQPVPLAGVSVSARVSIKTILFATDFSPCSELALPYATALARRYDATVLLTHVLTPEPAHLPIPPEPLYARDSMTQLRQRAELKGIRHEVRVERGALWTVLSDIVQQRKVDLIVAGTHGREGVRKLLLGSVAEEIFRHAPCPVLLVGPHVSRTAARFERILYATDFSPGSLHALPYALSLAREDGAHLTLLHVVQAGPAIPMELGAGAYEERMLADTEKQLRELVPPDAGLATPPQFRVEYGFAPESILGLAIEQRADLIVMGVHHGGAVATHVPWTVAHRVVCHSLCPVLTVRAD